MTDGGSESSVQFGFFAALTDADTIGDPSQHTGISDFDETDAVNMPMIPGVSTAPVFVAAIAYCELGRVERAWLVPPYELSANCCRGNRLKDLTLFRRVLHSGRITGEGLDRCSTGSPSTSACQTAISC